MSFFFSFKSLYVRKKQHFMFNILSGCSLISYSFFHVNPDSICMLLHMYVCTAICMLLHDVIFLSMPHIKQYSYSEDQPEQTDGEPRTLCWCSNIIYLTICTSNTQLFKITNREKQDPQMNRTIITQFVCNVTLYKVHK